MPLSFKVFLLVSVRGDGAKAILIVFFRGGGARPEAYNRERHLLQSYLLVFFSHTCLYRSISRVPLAFHVGRAVPKHGTAVGFIAHAAHATCFVCTRPWRLRALIYKVTQRLALGHNMISLDVDAQ